MTSSNKSTDEELSKIDAMIAQHSEVFDGPQLRYSASRQVRYEGNAQPGTATNKAGVPQGNYRCHRCGEAGHFIQDCPVDEATLRQMKTRQARGVPRAFLESISEAEAAKLGHGAFLNADGELVVMKTASKEERLRLVGPSIDIGLQRFFGRNWEECKKTLSCFLCQDVVKDPVVTNCCGELFCRQCILRHFDKTFTTVDGTISARECPNCDRSGLAQSDLVVDKALVAMMHEITGTVASSVGGNVTKSTGSFMEPNKRMRTANQTAGNRMQLDVELDTDLLNGVADARQDDRRTNIAIGKNSVLVPGGKLNPFFSKKGRVLKPEEFEKWKKLFKDALVHSGQGPLLSRRYPGISL